MNHLPAMHNIIQFHTKLNEFRESGKYVDVELKCEDRTFKCHRLALTMASEYFDVMFAGSFKECSDSTVELNEISADTLEQVINFLYTGDVVISSASVSDLLRASDFFVLPGMENLCIEFIRRNMNNASVETISNIFEFAHATNRNALKEVTILQIAQHFDLFCKTDLFLERMAFEDLHRILSLQYSLMPSTNEERLLSAIIQWVHHQYAERSRHLDEFFKLIKLENISSLYLRLLVDKIAASNQEVFNLVDNAEASKLPIVLNPEQFLHFYVGYQNEKLARIFSINNSGNCTMSDEISISSGFHGFRNITLDNSYLYCLSYHFGNSDSIPSDCQTFHAYTSINRDSRIALTLPPVVFQLPFLCHVQNNIYAYNARIFSRRTESPHSDMFTDEELNRSIFAYNCDLDKWFPVPPAKELPLEYAGITAYDNLVYLIGGEFSPGLAQAYDFRVEKWQKLPKTMLSYDDASCCSLDGKIYVCGGSSVLAERYDPVAGKWEEIALRDTVMAYAAVTPYMGKIWITENYYDDEDAIGENTDLTIDIYDPILNEWSSSDIIVDVEKEISPTSSGVIMDCVVFK